MKDFSVKDNAIRGLFKGSTNFWVIWTLIRDSSPVSQSSSSQSENKVWERL